MKKAFIAICCIVLVSCGSTKLITPGPSDAERGSKKFPGMTVASLNEGKLNFETQCTKCHGIKNPTSKSEEQWKSIVPKMSAKANKKAGSEVVDAKMQESILQYVVTMSGK